MRIKPTRTLTGLGEGKAKGYRVDERWGGEGSGKKEQHREGDRIREWMRGEMRREGLNKKEGKEEKRERQLEGENE